MTILRIVLTVFIACGFVTRGYAQKAKVPVTNIAPSLAIVAKVNHERGQLVIKTNATKTVPHTVTKMVPTQEKYAVKKGNKIITVTKTVYRPVTQTVYKTVETMFDRTIRLDAIAYFNNKGKELTTKEAAKRLKPGGVVLIATSR